MLEFIVFIFWGHKQANKKKKNITGWLKVKQIHSCKECFLFYFSYYLDLELIYLKQSKQKQKNSNKHKQKRYTSMHGYVKFKTMIWL